MTLKLFNAKLRRFAKDNEVNVTTTMRLVTLQILVGAVEKTPFDTGRAKGGWQVDVNQPAVSADRPLDPSGAQTIQEGATKLRALEFGDRTFVSNNVEYISYLEYGTRSQPANGMLRLTLEEVGSQFE